MTDFEIIATVMLAFFIVGTGVGIVMVIALSALRQRRELPPPGWPPPPPPPPPPGPPGPPGWPGTGGSSEDPPRWPDG